MSAHMYIHMPVHRWLSELRSRCYAALALAAQQKALYCVIVDSGTNLTLAERLADLIATDAPTMDPRHLTSFIQRVALPYCRHCPPAAIPDLVPRLAVPLCTVVLQRLNASWQASVSGDCFEIEPNGLGAMPSATLREEASAAALHNLSRAYLALLELLVGVHAEIAEVVRSASGVADGDDEEMEPAAPPSSREARAQFCVYTCVRTWV